MNQSRVSFEPIENINTSTDPRNQLLNVQALLDASKEQSSNGSASEDSSVIDEKHPLYSAVGSIQKSNIIDYLKPLTVSAAQTRRLAQIANINTASQSTAQTASPKGQTPTASVAAKPQAKANTKLSIFD